MEAVTTTREIDKKTIKIITIAILTLFALVFAYFAPYIALMLAPIFAWGLLDSVIPKSKKKPAKKAKKVDKSDEDEEDEHWKWSEELDDEFWFNWYSGYLRHINPLYEDIYT